MSKKLNLVGKAFGKLLVVSHETENQRGYSICKCECGITTKVRNDSLTSGKTTSCGCFSREVAKEVHTSHGDSNARLYRIYKKMKARCYYQKNERYDRYGGRGISICDEWLSDYKEFKRWAITNGYTDELSIDRIDNDGDYTPENCRWVGIITQSNNKGNNRRVADSSGNIKTVAEWSRALDVPYRFMHNRIRCGKTVEEIALEFKEENNDAN